MSCALHTAHFAIMLLITYNNNTNVKINTYIRDIIYYYYYMIYYSIFEYLLRTLVHILYI